MRYFKQYRYEQEVKLVLEYFSHSITRAKTKKLAAEEIEFCTYMLSLVKDKYYGGSK